MAGKVEEVGMDVKEFQTGDDVYWCVQWILCRICVCL
ncbi:alcohol dehydrogenase catalytic domain-containing protein [Bacillus sp. DJP31]